jgi:hypothetical protein
VFIPDQALESALRANIGKPFGFLTENDLLGVVSLDARNLKIRSIEGIQYCLNLAWLDLDTNAISDITPLAQLGRRENPFDSPLTYLNLDGNQISDIGPLTGLLNLQGLSLFGNQVADIGPLVANALNGGLGEGDYVVLDASTLNDQAINVDIPTLQSNGVNVVAATVAAAATGG